MIQSPPPAGTEPNDASRGGLPRNVKILGLASLLNDVASEIIFPLLGPFLLTVIKASKLELGAIEGAADSLASLLKLWSGGVSDQSGRRKGFVVFGYTIAAVARPLVGLVGAPWQVFAIRLGDRFGKGLRTSPRDAMIADSTTPSQRGRAFGFHRAMDHLGAAVGPLLATAFLLVWPDQMRTLFLLTIIPGLLVVALIAIGLHEPPHAEKPREKLHLTLRPFDRNFKLYLVSLVVFTLGNSTDLFLLVRSGELGVPTAWLPVLWCVFHIVKSASNLYLGRAVDRHGSRGFILAGWLVYAVVYLAFGVATNALHAWGLFLAYAVFYGFTEPAEKALVAKLAGGERKGLAFGWYNCAIGIATLPASLIFGKLYDSYGALTAFGTGAALAGAAAALLLGVREGKSS